MKKLFLVDAYALIYRYYYAFLSRPMRNREGVNTSVVFGFTKFLRDILKREQPDLLGVAFDPKGGSFRGVIFPEYKANRQETPEDIHLSVPYVKRLLEAMCIPILEVEGYEADDVIGTLSQKGVEAGYEVFMVTPDKDYGQLVGDNCKIYKQKGDGIEIVDKAAIELKYGVTDPVLVRDILAIWGDASDNIPGVPGIGEKGACKLVQAWGTVENILANADKIGGKQGEKIAAWGDKLLFAKQLTTICLDVPIPFREQDLTMCAPNIDELKVLFAELDFTHFMSDIGNRVPAEPLSEGPHQPPQTQFVDAARAKTQAKLQASLVGQGDLFATPAEASATLSEDGNDHSEEQAAQEHSSLQTAATTTHDYQLITTHDQLREVVAEVMRHPEFCFDTETTGLDIFNDRIVGLSLAVRAHHAWYIQFTAENSGQFVELLRPLFENESIAKIAQNMKFDLMVLRRLGLEIAGRRFDTMIIHYLLDPEGRHNMNALAERYLNYKPIEIESLIGRGVRQLTMDMVSIERVKEYGAEDADVTLQLKQLLWPQIEESGLEQLYTQIEEPMIGVLADIEMAGVRIDCVALAEYAVELNATLIDLESQIRELAEVPTLNINSTRQLGEVLFARMRIAEKPKMTKTKQFCTDEEYLQGFAHKHKIVDLILQYRGVKKLVSTYVEALPLLVNRQTGRIHTSYNQAVTATGRLSSTNPNLQNIPVRDDMGRRIRRAFIPTDSDHLLLAADYSQVELRLMAHLSADHALIEAFENGEDIHAATAARLFNKSIDQVTSDERRKAKTANFGIIYGISAFGLSQRLEISRTEAKEIIDGYFSSYPGVKSYMDSVVQQARVDGFVTTIFGRRRYLREIESPNATIRGLAERNAINAPIQGSAADIMKIAMVNVHRAFAAEGLCSKVILQVHDELVVDMLRTEQEQVTRILTREMEHAAALKVKLIADHGIGDNWLEAH